MGGGSPSSLLLWGVWEVGVPSMRTLSCLLLFIVGVAIVPSALSACSTASSSCTCGAAGWYPNMSTLSLPIPTPQNLTCTAINVTKITIPNGICVWDNLAGQTPDKNIYENYGSKN